MKTIKPGPPDRLPRPRHRGVGCIFGRRRRAPALVKCTGQNAPVKCTGQAHRSKCAGQVHRSNSAAGAASPVAAERSAPALVGRRRRARADPRQAGRSDSERRPRPSRRFPRTPANVRTQGAIEVRWHGQTPGRPGEATPNSETRNRRFPRTADSLPPKDEFKLFLTSS